MIFFDANPRQQQDQHGLGPDPLLRGAGCRNDSNGADGAFQGGVYVVHSCHVHGGGILLGPLICGQIDVDGTGTAAFTFPPVTMYESPVTTSSIHLDLGPQSG